ncbi:MFS transporter, partial [Mycobacterium tuberculosis]|nr:MFS transporter [Mycobacterium tuberculosis]
RYLPHDQAHQPPPFDFVGCALLSLAMIALSLAIDPPVPTHRAAWAAGLAVLGLASALAYLPHARRRAQPLFRLGLFR